MSRLGLVSVTLAWGLVLLLAPRDARACSCAILSHPSLERCQAADRVFAGTVGPYDWPTAIRATAEDSVTIDVTVDRVWRGAVPARLTVETHPLGGPGSCTVYPAPGERFLACDDEAADAAPIFSVCAGSAMGADAAPLIAGLGPGEAPREPMSGSTRRPWWTYPQRLKASAKELLLLLAPFAVALLGAGLGALLSRIWPKKQALPSLRRLALVLLAAAAVVIAARVALHRTLPPAGLLFDCVTLGPSAAACLFGLIIGARAQRRGPRGVRGVAFALVAVAVVLTAGYARLHLPAQPVDAVACSEARAREHLRSYPRGEPRDAVVEWARSAPRACTDWGLAPIVADEESASPALGFADGRGGMYWLYARSPTEVARTYLWELP